MDAGLRQERAFEIRLCRPYWAKTMGEVESGVKYVRRNTWPSMRFTDDADLNRQALEWCDSVADRLVHGTTRQQPVALPMQDCPHLGLRISLRVVRLLPRHSRSTHIGWCTDSPSSSRAGFSQPEYPASSPVCSEVTRIHTWSRQKRSLWLGYMVIDCLSAAPSRQCPDRCGGRRAAQFLPPPWRPPAHHDA